MALGRTLSSPELDALYKYLTILLKWQSSQRLAASDDPRWIAEHLMADSLLFLKVLPAVATTLVDIGSGAGFPGIPVKIARPDLSVTLIESRQRRASFLRAVVRELDLSDVTVIDQRLESFSPTGLGFDVATMRCAGDPRRLLAAALSLVRPGGIVVASGPPVDRSRQRSTSLAPIHTAGAEPGFESAVVSGLYGKTRQFLVARKS